MSAIHHEKSGQKRAARKCSNLDVHLVSESTGGLARHLVGVALSQFPKLEYSLYEHPFCTNLDTLREARKTIELTPETLVFSALASPRLKRSLANWCDRRNIEHRELVQPLVNFLESHTGHRSIRDAGQTHQCNDEYFRRIDAWEFTLQHDDSRRLDSVGEADLILLGVSRVGKTPLAAYLGSQGYRVANISIAHNAAVPREVAEHRRKIIGLTIDADRLAIIRKRRFELNRFAQARDSHVYFSAKSALEDVLFAEEHFRKLGIQKLDVTDLTVEELAVRVLACWQATQTTSD